MVTTFKRTLATCDISEIPVFVVDGPVTLLVQHLDGSVLPLLRDLAAVPHLNEDGMETIHDDVLAVIDVEQIGKNGVVTWCLPVLL